MLIGLALSSLVFSRSLPNRHTLAIDIASHLAARALTVSALRYIKGRRRRRIINGRRLSRRQIRKIVNRERRHFVDNIIMHHRRLHENNRQNIVRDARKRVLEKQKKKALMLEQGSRKKWQDRSGIKEKCAVIKGRISSRRERARSRWISVIKVEKLAN